MRDVGRRDFITLLGGAAAWPLAARAQHLHHIGMLDHTSAELNAANLNGFRQGMLELGYVEGQHFVIEYRSADGRVERYPDLAAELVRLKVDAIVTRGTPAALAAKNATSTIPIISAALAEPLLVVSSISRPGGNVTGLSALTSDLEAKRLELLREMIPGIVRIAVLYNMANPVFGDRWRQIQVTARSLGIQVVLLDARAAGDIARSFDAASAQSVDALVVSNDGLYARKSEIYRRARSEAQAPGRLRIKGVHRGRRADLLCSEHPRFVSARRELRTQGFDRCARRRSSDRATDQIRVDR
jgi:putative ABC transport system substrate-binding protein